MYFCRVNSMYEGMCVGVGKYSLFGEIQSLVWLEYRMYWLGVVLVEELRWGMLKGKFRCGDRVCLEQFSLYLILRVYDIFI